jgi:hypothetical protein
MNVNVRPKAFAKRKPSPIQAMATGSAETFTRYVCVKAVAQLTQRPGREDQVKIATERFPGDARLRTVIRAAAEPPTDLSNTPALARMGVDFIEALQPVSAAARLFRASEMMLSFDRETAILVPDVFGVDEGPPAWVASGQPAPVGELTANATILQPRKLEFIITVTREMLLGSNAEKLIGDALRTKIAFDLDKTVFDALPESAARPAGLRSYNTRLPESNWTSGNDNAMLQDVGTLMAAAEAIAGGSEFYFIARSRRIAAMRQLYKQVPPNLVLLPSSASLALPDSVLLCVIPRAVPSAIGLAEVELVDAAAVEMDDAPGSPDVMTGASVRSFFQTDTLGLKVRLPASWGLRHPAGANWITCLWPSDMGAGTGGGIPDAPADDEVYGRHMGAWSPVVEEAPATPPATGFIRTNVQTSPWVPLENFLAPYAPLASPAFIGTPTAPTQLQADSTTRLATTQFVHDVAGAASGVEDVPTTPNGAYARFRTSPTVVSWVDFATLGVAGTFSPQFTGNPTAPTPPNGDASDRLATTQFVADNGGAGGVEDVPPTPSGAYARTRLSGNPAGWTSFVDLRIASLDSPAFAGAPTLVPTPPAGTANAILANTDFVARDFLNVDFGTMRGNFVARTGGSATNVAVGFGDPATGFYRSGNLIVMAASGGAVAQFSDTVSAIFSPLFMNSNRIQMVGDATAGTDALNQQTADGRYMRPGGPALTDTLTTKPGTGVNDLGLAVGDGATGFYRDAVGTSAGLSTMVGGFPLFMLLATREAVINGPLSVAGSRIMAVANPTTGTDALNMQTGDARYLTLQNGGIVAGAVQFLFNPILPTDAVNKGYVDGARAKPVIYDLPANVTIAATGAWVDLAQVPIVLPAGVNRNIMVIVSCNLGGIGNVALFAVRLGIDQNPGTPERREFGYGSAATPSTGFSAVMVVDVASGAVSIPVQIRWIDTGAGAPGTLFAIGGAANDARSQITIVDLGPV